MVDLDPSKLTGPAARVNITLPERLLAQIDRAAAAENMTRSGFLATAALARIAGPTRSRS
jgi:metal-responsive CopG/Arc/MetJ family transcriptional regulator